MCRTCPCLFVSRQVRQGRNTTFTHSRRSLRLKLVKASVFLLACSLLHPRSTLCMSCPWRTSPTLCLYAARLRLHFGAAHELIGVARRSLACCPLAVARGQCDSALARFYVSNARYACSMPRPRRSALRASRLGLLVSSYDCIRKSRNCCALNTIFGC